MIQLTEQNFILYAAKNYDNPCCGTMEEFQEDINRFKYIKRLFTKYSTGAELKDRLIMNHLIILYNLFGVPACTRMLFFRLEGQWQYLKPFLIAINQLPERVEGIGKHPTINTSDLPMDAGIVAILRKI